MKPDKIPALLRTLTLPEVTLTGIGVILGYKNKDKKVSLGSSFGQSSYDPKNVVRSVGFFEKNGKVTTIDYDKFVSAIKKIQNE